METSARYAFQLFYAAFTWNKLRARRDGVGEPVSTSRKPGAVHPRTTRRAFPFLVPRGWCFQVRTHRMRMMLRAGMPAFSEARQTSAFKKDWISTSFASPSSFCSSSESLRGSAGDVGDKDTRLSDESNFWTDSGSTGFWLSI